MSDEKLEQVRAQIKAVQASVRESRESKQGLKAADKDYICTFWLQYKTFTGQTMRKKRSKDDLETSTDNNKPSGKKRKTTYSESEMDSILARHCEESAVKFSEAITMFDIHEDRCGPPLINQHTTTQLLKISEAYRDGERRRQIAILKSLGFDFISSIDELDQTSVGRIWLQSELRRYSP